MTLMHIYWFIVIGIVVCLFGGCVLYLCLPIQKAGKIADEMKTTAMAYEQHPLLPRERILVAGDSTAFGLGAIDNKESIAGRLGQTYPEADIVNIGVNGLRLAELGELLKSQQDLRYDLIVLQIGANDITGMTRKAKIVSELGNVLMVAQNMSEKVILITAGNIGSAPIFRWPLSIYLSERTRVVRSIFMAEAGKYPGVQYVDLFHEIKDEPFRSNVSLYYASDLFHPSGAGYGLWYESIRSFLLDSTYNVKK